MFRSIPVSYTHLDVYKRQGIHSRASVMRHIRNRTSDAKGKMMNYGSHERRLQYICEEMLTQTKLPYNYFHNIPIL